MAENYRFRFKQGEVEFEIEGDKEFVEKHIKVFEKEMPKIPKDRVELETFSLVEFYKLKQPKDHNETVVVFAYWLTKKDQQEEFKPRDITACYDGAKIPLPKNVQQHVSAMASGKKAYLTAGTKNGWYKLTLTGEDFVEKELPRKSKE